MDSLSVNEIIEGLNSGTLKFADIEDHIKQLSSNDIEDIAMNLQNDKDKIPFLKYTFRQLKIIRFFKEDVMVNALKEIKNEDLRFKAITTYLKSDEAKIEGIKTLSDSKKMMARITLSREGAKQYFLPQQKKYSEIGLDKSITLGMEIETEGENSHEIIEIGKRNGIKINEKMSGSMDVDMECGTVLRSRRKS